MKTNEPGEELICALFFARRLFFQPVFHLHIGEGFVPGVQGGQQGKQPSLSDRLHDQAVTLLVDDRFVPFQFGRAGIRSA